MSRSALIPALVAMALSPFAIPGRAEEAKPAPRTETRTVFGDTDDAPPPVPQTPPYRYASLRGLSDDEILRYMGRGRSVREIEAAAVIRTCAAKDFWTLPPKEAALATAEANRKEAHRRGFRLAVDDAGRKPPDAGTLLFSFFSDRSYNAVVCHYFLRFDPKGSYLLYARAWEPGIVFYNVVHAQAAYDLRRCDVTYEEARQMAQAAWWLNCVRSSSSDDSRFHGRSVMHTTADGKGTLQIRPEGNGDDLLVTDTIWPGAVSARWTDKYDTEVFLNLAAHLVMDELPRRLGDRWTRWEPSHSHNVLARQESDPQYTDPELKRLRETVGGFLDLFSEDGRRISYPIVTEAVAAAGHLVYADLAERLKAMADGLSVPAQPVRDEAAIEAEIRKIRGEHDTASLDRWMELNRELDAIRSGVEIPAARETLRKAIALSLRQISAVGNLETLQAWATSRQPGCQWALQQLGRMDPDRYVKALEWWMKSSQGGYARQFFQAIARASPDRARELALELPPDRKGDLTVQAFTLLDKAKAIPDEPKRVAALIKLLLDPKSGWDQRGQAIDCLVPPDAPLKYPDREIDEALLKCLDSKLADDLINFTLGKASRALAQRGRTEHFDALVAALSASKDGTVSHVILGALAHMALQGGAGLKTRLLPVLKPHLHKTTLLITEVIWAVWAADLRELKGDLEAIATARPEDPEGPKASSYGGEPKPVSERYHLARQVAAVWNEEDPVARAKLLIVLGHGRAERTPERLAALRQEIQRMAGLMTPEQSQDLRRYVEWIRTKGVMPDVYETVRDAFR